MAAPARPAMAEDDRETTRFPPPTHSEPSRRHINQEPRVAGSEPRRRASDYPAGAIDEAQPIHRAETRPRNSSAAILLAATISRPAADRNDGEPTKDEELQIALEKKRKNGE